MIALERDDNGDFDQVVVMRNLQWEDYERLLERRGDGRRPRMAYLSGELEIVSPSSYHEWIADVLARLTAEWCDAHGVGWTALRSWTLTDRSAEVGLEPDECFVVGDHVV